MNNYIERFSKFDLFGSDIAKEVMKRKDMKISLLLLLLFLAVALTSPWISPYDPNAVELENKNLAPSFDHPLGTDYLGRDILSRIFVGATTSLSIAVGVVSASVVFGVIVGCVSGYYGGLIDELLCRVIDLFLSFPGIIFALTIMGVLGSGKTNLMFALAVVQWASYARLMRGQVLSVRKNEYVLSAKVIGTGDARIIWKHIIPNSIAPAIVLATIDVGHVILSIAALSFLGIGLPANVPEWGAMLSAGKEFMRVSPSQTIFPGLTITAIVVIFSILGDGMRDILDPNDKGRNLF
ncbi:ABC transporter permease [Methanococcoides sp. SA1]|nr:ABC transporter permease [Methanococcoides sp. SA1]